MLHENVKLNDDELADIIKDLSEFTSDDDQEMPAGDDSFSRHDEPMESSEY